MRHKYGLDQVAQIITFGKLQARAVLRDVGRVLQMPYSQVDRICKLVITSYSIHYTKLYENRHADDLPLGGRVQAELRVADRLLVITSYSIHYTKLYDATSVLICAGVPSARISPAAMIASRSQYSASSMKWVVTSTVTPRRP